HRARLGPGEPPRDRAKIVEGARPLAAGRTRADRKRANLGDRRRLFEVREELRRADERPIRLEARGRDGRERLFVTGELLPTRRARRAGRPRQDAHEHELEFPLRDLRKEVLPADLLPLLRRLETAVNGPGGGPLDRVASRPAAAADRTAAT